MMFVSIACGAISGFHATQSPMMARLPYQREIGQTYLYGAMVAEGIVALIWAAAVIALPADTKDWPNILPPIPAGLGRSSPTYP